MRDREAPRDNQKFHAKNRAVFIQERGRDTAAASRGGLLDLVFFELDVLASDWVVLLEHQLFGARARVLLGDVEEAGAGGAQELDLGGC